MFAALLRYLAAAAGTRLPLGEVQSKGGGNITAFTPAIPPGMAESIASRVAQYS